MWPTRRSAPGTFRKEAGAIRASNLALIALIGVAGCGSKSQSKSDAPVVKKPEKPIFGESMSVETDPGEAVIRNEAGKTLYKVAWQSARLNFGDQGAISGTMEKLQGAMYQDELPMNTFTAESGEAVRAQSLLKLSGGVIVQSKERKARIRCDRLEWWADKKLVKAIGHVRATGDFGSLGEFPELWATADMSIIATPDMFKR